MPKPCADSLRPRKLYVGPLGTTHPSLLGRVSAARADTAWKPALTWPQQRDSAESLREGVEDEKAEWVG